MTDPRQARPLVSVILPVYNGEGHLSASIRSVLAQDYRPLEVIIVDDGSTDGTAEIAKSYTREDAVRYSYQENAGPAAARNFGISQAEGEFVAFIDADDLWPENKLSRQVHCLLEHPQAALVQGTIEKIKLQEKDGRLQEVRDPDFPFIYTNLGAMLVRKAVFDQIGPFAASLKYHEDTDFWLRVREAGLPVLVLPQRALIYRIHGANLTTGTNVKSTGFIRILKRSLDRRKASQTGPQRDAVPPLTFLGLNTAQNSPTDYAKLTSKGKPLVSVILHLSSADDAVEEVLHNILGQQVRPLDLILTGHGIPAAAAAKVQAAFARVKIVDSPSGDLADQLNEAIALAEGEWLAFLSTGAIWREGKLRAQLAYLQSHPQAEILAGRTSPIVEPCQPYPAKTLDSLNLQKSIGDFLDTLLVKKDILEDIGPFKAGTSGMMETDWLLRAKDLGHAPVILPKVLLYRMIQPDNAAPEPKELRSALLSSLHSSIRRKRKPETD